MSYTDKTKNTKNERIKYSQWLTEDSLELVGCWVRDGLRDFEIAEKIGVAPKTICEWKDKYPKFRQAFSRGKEMVDYKVENALLKCALGYKTKDIKVVVIDPDTGNAKVRREVTEKEIGPNAMACLAWLNNRKAQQWKRNRDNEVQLDDEDNNITINIIKHSDAEKEKEAGSTGAENKAEQQ